MNTQLNQFELEVKEALHQLDAGWGMPTRWYHEQEVFRFEMASIYGRERPEVHSLGGLRVEFPR